MEVSTDWINLNNKMSIRTKNSDEESRNKFENVGQPFQKRNIFPNYFQKSSGSLIKMGTLYIQQF